jgi:hypothetical protein
MLAGAAACEMNQVWATESASLLVQAGHNRQTFAVLRPVWAGG